MELVLRSGSLRELLSQLQSHTLDVLLSHLPVRREAENSWHSHRLEEQPVALVDRKNSGNAEFKFPDDLAKTLLLLLSLDTNLRAAFDFVMEREGIIPMIAAEVDAMSMLRLLAPEGAGLALIPPVVVSRELKRGLLVEVYRFKDLSEIFTRLLPVAGIPMNWSGNCCGSEKAEGFLKFLGFQVE